MSGGAARFVQIAVVLALCAGGIVARLHRLQVVDRTYWEEAAVKARTRETPIAFRRGAIVDARGRLLATTRVSDDLDFVFAHFRRGSTTGQLLLVQYLLTCDRLTAAQVFADPAAVLDPFAALTVGELRTITSGARRADLLVYGAWLGGGESSRPLVDRLRDASADEPCCPDLAPQRDAILARVADEAAALAELERALGMERGALVRAIDDSIRATDARVLRLLAKKEGVTAGRRDAVANGFERERELHKELDDRPTTLLKNVRHEIAFDLALDPRRLPGLVVTERTRRVYPAENDVAPLLIGRVGLPTEEGVKALEEARDKRDELALEAEPTVEQVERLEQLDDQIRTTFVQPDEEIGIDGLERSFEPLLRGRRGSKRTENDRAGRELAVVELQEPRAGRDLVLTLDSEWQRAAERDLALGVPVEKGGPREHFNGAFVLIELSEMKVRVLASCPPLSRETIATSDYESFAADPSHPLHPRAWKPYLPPPPGSSIKPLVAAFALTAGEITPATRLLCNRNALYASATEKKPIKCEGDHGEVDLHEALVKSCNHYFAQVARKVGSEQMVAWFRSVGFGTRTGLATVWLDDGTAVGGLAGEVAGTAKSEPGVRNLMLLGMGQGWIDTTPLQMAAAIGAMALRRYQAPTLIEKIGDETPQRPPPGELAISESALETVVAAMRDVTLAGGTAGPGENHPADLTAFDLATKTGTPQQGDVNDKDHSWFVGFFPSRAPRYAFAIFLERTGHHGGEAAAPLLADLFADPAFAELAAVARRKPTQERDQ